MRKDTAELIREISKMAARVGAAFVPDERKIAAFESGRPKTSEDAA